MSGRPRKNDELRRIVYRIVRRIPRGKVATYGQIAAVAGRPRAARAVGRALGALSAPMASVIPWHRVVSSAGRVSFRDEGWPERQREILEREGVRFGPSGRIDLARHRWKPRSRPEISAKRRQSVRKRGQILFSAPLAQ